MTLLRHSAQPSATRWVAYYSNLDLIVPARRAMILEPELEATNILVKDTGHLSIMLSRRLSSSIVDQLGAAEGLAGYGAPVRALTPVDRRRAADAAPGSDRAVGLRRRPGRASPRGRPRAGPTCEICGHRPRLSTGNTQACSPSDAQGELRRVSSCQRSCGAFSGWWLASWFSAGRTAPWGRKAFVEPGASSAEPTGVL